jgi:hypothetical protein
MATVTVYTAARMKAIEDASVIDGEVVGDNLILTRFDESTIDAGNVRGPVGPVGSPNPVGTFIMGGWEVDPDGYFLLDGSVIIGGVVTYPDLAACFPSWVSGGNINLPNASGAVPMAGPTPGVVSGSMNHTILAANLPPHAHTGPSHQHSGPSHQHTGHYHNHDISHGHSTGGTSTANAPHSHASSGNTGGTGFIYRGPGGAGFDVTNTGAAINLYYHELPGTTVANAPHSHTIDVHAYGGFSTAGGNIGDGLTGASGTGLTGAGGTGNTGGGPGTSSPVDHTPKNLTVTYAVKHDD